MRLPRWLRRSRRRTRQVTPQYGPVPRPRVHHAPVPWAPDLWEDHYQRIRALAIPQEAQDAMIKVAEDRRYGGHPMDRHRWAEFNVPDEPE
jgi:hypothetical protein